MEIRYDTDSARDSLNVLEELIYECRYKP